MQRRNLIAATGGAFLFGALAPVAQAATQTTLRVGVTAGLHAEILEKVIPFAKARGLNIKVYEFQDYVRPNAALAEGDLDINIFQTKPFLDAACRDRGYKLVPVGETFTFPMAFYSKKVKSLKEVKKGARVGIPNDPSQGGRALLLLASSGLIRLKDPKNLLASPLDIAENKLRLRIVELEAAQLPHALGDLDIAAINGNYANSAGLNPTRDGILVEGGDSPYVNHIVVKEKDKNQPWVKTFVEAYRQPEVSAFIKANYKGTVIPSF